MVQIFFAYFALVSIAAGILTVSLRSPVHCGIALLALLGHVAGLFVLLHAEFVAVVQIIIYAGAILILYLFVLMLLNLKTEERYFHRRHAWYITGVGALTVELLMVLLASRFDGAKGPATVEAVEQIGNSMAIGIVMFSDYLLLFEIVGVFLLGAIVGAIVLAKTPSQADLSGDER
ncbi:MAG: NADH-quinone oxidoreductase subunit J [Nitrospirota bacterium]